MARREGPFPVSRAFTPVSLPKCIMIIHEQQVRQHCAIHAVNNLLQLPSTLVYDQEVVEEQLMEMMQAMTMK